jgi:hypothetical protein
VVAVEDLLKIWRLVGSAYDMAGALHRVHVLYIIYIPVLFACSFFHSWGTYMMDTHQKCARCDGSRSHRRNLCPFHHRIPDPSAVKIQVQLRSKYASGDSKSSRSIIVKTENTH